MANLGQLTRDIFCAINASSIGDLIRLIIRSILVEGNLFAIIDFVNRREMYLFVLSMACVEMIFT